MPQLYAEYAYQYSNDGTEFTGPVKILNQYHSSGRFVRARVEDEDGDVFNTWVRSDEIDVKSEIKRRKNVLTL